MIALRSVTFVESFICNRPHNSFFFSQCDWWRERLELLEPYQPSAEVQMQTWDRLAWAQGFERFLHKKYQDKRFGLDGGESSVLAIKAVR